jgi:hypothetical protein
VANFLCTRVKAPTLEDKEKLEYLLGYLQRTKKCTMVVKPKGTFRVKAYIDACFVTHRDGKLHSRLMVMIGGVGVLFASRKQKCVSKSPTESELIAFSDNIGLVKLFHEFLTFVLNCRVEVPIVYQDNMWVIRW